MKFTVLLLLLLAGTLSAQEHKLMFGQETERAETKVFLDFSYISAESPLFTPKSSFSRHQWIYNPALGRPGSLPGDTLLEHNLNCREVQLVLPCETPEATVRVWIGDWNSGWRRLWNENTIRLSCNGQPIYEQTITPQSAYDEWCKLEDYVFSRQDPIWDRLISPILRQEVFTVKPVEGKITLHLQNIILTALTVSSTAEQDQATAGAVEAERRRQFAQRYPWKPLPDEPLPELSESVRQRGYVLFQKLSDDLVHPWSRPVEEEISDTIRAFAARGEQELLRFGVLPLVDLPELTVTVGDFHGPGGILRTAEHADLWRERYKEQGSRSTNGIITSMRQLDPISYVLQSMKPQPGEAGTPRMFTLDFRVPVETQPGDYLADLQVVSAGKAIGSARLQLKVLPFELNYRGAATYNFTMSYCHWTDWMGLGKDKSSIREVMRKQILFPMKYRFNPNQFNPWGYGMETVFPLGKISGEPGDRHFTQTPEQTANFDWWMENFRQDPECRFIDLVPRSLFLNCGWRLKDWGRRTQEERENYQTDLQDIETLTREIDQMCKQRNYPEIFWYYDGEIDNYGSQYVQFAVQVAEAVNRVGATSYVTINGPLAYKAAPPVFQHVWANPATPIDENLLAEIKKHGHQFGSHNSGDNRFQAGFWFWRTGAEGKYQETSISYANYMLPYCLLPWNYNTSLVYPDPETCGQRPSLQFLNYREGRDDYLYLYTLEQLLKQAKADSPARQAAQAFLSEMSARIHIDQRKYHAAKFDGIEGTADIKNDEWNGYCIERFRWKLATLIRDLEKAL